MEVGSSKRVLTEAEKARIERNRIRAQHLRESKVAISKETENGNRIKIDGSKFVDSNGGFLIDERELNSDEATAAKQQKLSEEAEEVPVSYLECMECSEEFIDSYLWKNFDLSCCDKCKDLDEKHELITRTDAKTEYLLKDCDLDKREPVLKFLARKNPHKSNWAEMKLYLRSQVKARAMEIYKTEDNLEQERFLREEKREVSKVKKFNKQLSELRKSVRSTLYDKRHTVHAHEYGPSSYNEETEEYTHKCKTCGFIETYEEL